MHESIVSAHPQGCSLAATLSMRVLAQAQPMFTVNLAHVLLIFLQQSTSVFLACGRHSRGKNVGSSIPSLSALRIYDAKRSSVHCETLLPLCALHKINKHTYNNVTLLHKTHCHMGYHYEQTILTRTKLLHCQTYTRTISQSPKTKNR